MGEGIQRDAEQPTLGEMEQRLRDDLIQLYGWFEESATTVKGIREYWWWRILVAVLGTPPISSFFRLGARLKLTQVELLIDRAEQAYSAQSTRRPPDGDEKLHLITTAAAVDDLSSKFDQLLRYAQSIRSHGIWRALSTLMSTAQKRTWKTFDEQSDAFNEWGLQFEQYMNAHIAPLHYELEEKLVKNHDEPITDIDVDIIVCVHNALEELTRCLESLGLALQSPNRRLILVDDGSDEDTAQYLEGFSRTRERVELIRSDKAGGYTKAANRGLKSSTAEIVVLLNSDTMATQGWLERIIEVFDIDEKIGIVGPLSNAASYQSLPRARDERGSWALNTLPDKEAITHMASLIQAVSSKQFPKVTFINGFCFAIRRAVIEEIGYLDEAAFPRGYGEENDYCLRASTAGYKLAVADHAYVYHAKTKSYSEEAKLELTRDGMKALYRKHGRIEVEAAIRAMEADGSLDHLRALVLRHGRFKKLKA